MMKVCKRLTLLGMVLCFMTSCVGNKQTVIKTPVDAPKPFGPTEAKAAGIKAPQNASLLSAKETSEVLNRMTPLYAEAGDTKDFSMREKSLPPPRTGKEIQGQFPAATNENPPSPAPAGDLRILRYGPEGDVPIAPQVSVSFSQPMVPLSAVEEIATLSSPVKISPEVPGKWRWMGTQTLVFQAEGRFPMATEFSVAIPASTRSELGGSLQKTLNFSFTTPPPIVVSAYPYASSTTDQEPVFFLSFNQDINPKDVLAKISVKAKGKSYSLRLASENEQQKDKNVVSLIEATEKGRWLAFRATRALPKDTKIFLTVDSGVPSVEGPLRSKSPYTRQFKTYGPMKVVRHSCEKKDKCYPGSSFYVEFSNPILLKDFQEKMVRVSPKIANFRTDPSGRYLYLSGNTKARTTYKVTLDKKITDVYGQKLEQRRPLTLYVGEGPKRLSAARSGFVVLDPNGGKNFSIFSQNHKAVKVRLYQVGLEDWEQFTKYVSNRSSQNRPNPPGTLVSSKTLKVDFVADELIETRIDLSPVIQGSYGHAFLIVEPTVQPKQYWQRQEIYAWVQDTDIALDAFVDGEDILAWATALQDGKPLRDVSIGLYSGAKTVKTGPDGLASISLGQTPQSLLVARKGDDVALLPQNTYNTYSGWKQSRAKDQIRWYVFNDRQLYRPGEEINIKGWLRVFESRKGGDITTLPSSMKKVNYILRDSQGNEITKGNLSVNKFGGFSTALSLPDTINLGYTNLSFSFKNSPADLRNTEHSHVFQIEEFRRPEFEVKAFAEEKGPYFVDQKAKVNVQAKYYAGGGLPEAPVTWQVSSSPGQYSPPNWNDYTFGTFVPWWGYHSYERGYGGYTQPTYRSYSGTTDASGNHMVELEFTPVDPPRPLSVLAQATVQDVNRQAWTASTNLLVHPSSLYIGLKSEKVFVQKGQPLLLDAIVVDIDGKVVSGKNFVMKASRLSWEIEDGTWTQKEVDSQECRKTSSSKEIQCRFDAKEGGTYRVTASVSDDKGRKNQSEINVWVSGGKTRPNRNIAKQEVMLIPDKKEYKVGDVAEILVMAPFTPAEGLITLRRSGIVSKERFSMDQNSYTLRVAIKEEFLPNLSVQVDLVGASYRTNEQGEFKTELPKQPAFASGVLSLSIPPRERTLDVKIVPKSKEVEPGKETSLAIEVKDQNGKPVSGGEIAVVVVDEAVLALSNYSIPDPLSIFYIPRNAGVSEHYLRSSVALSSIDDLVASPPPPPPPAGVPGGVIGGIADDASPAEMEQSNTRLQAIEADKSATLGGSFANNNAATPQIRVRENFNALALFAANVTTDKKGKANVSVKIPDNLTRYRIMAVVVEGEKRFGAKEETITARLPLMVRPSPPRFLNFGDKFELPVVLQNQTDKAMDVNIALRATNTSLPGGVGYSVSVPANDRIEVRFPLETKLPGIARFQVGAVSRNYSDANEFSLPIYTPATTEAFATYGEIDEGSIVQTVKAPDNVYDAFGGIEISTSSTALSSLTDAVLYLQSYPYECAEQVSSRIMSIAALRDVLTAFEAEELPSPQEMISSVNRDLKKLQSMQNYDGGFGFWYRGQESWPFLSIHVGHAIARAKQKSFQIPGNMQGKVLAYLQSIESKIPAWYSIESKRALIAYALYVRNLLGNPDAPRARKLLSEAGLDKLSMEAIGWLLPTLSQDGQSKNDVERIRRHLQNRVEERAGTAHFVSSYSDGEYVLLHSERRTDGILLEAMIQDMPENTLIPKIVAGLLAHRTKGRWGNTQENAFILLALDRYFNTYENVTPNFVAKAWLGDTFAGENKFKGRTTDKHHIEIPMKYVAKNSQEKLILSKEGKGRLYYRLGMQYAPQDLTLKPADYGFSVKRVYEAVDDPDDVKQDPDGSWRIKAGSKVRVRLTMIAKSRRYHVALVDALPAGLETLNPSLATTGTQPQDPQKSAGGATGYWWYRNWFSHQNLRDERVEAFSSLLAEGEYTYSYLTRATTPGSFVVPPAKAEEMYSPETFGRSGTDKVIVEERP